MALSRRLLLAGLAVLVPLSALGVWLLFAGPLHEPPETAQLRKKLAQENRALQERVGRLDQDLDGLRRQLARLDEQKVNALLLSGIGFIEEEKKEKSGRLFSFFQGLSPMKADVAASLERARALSHSLDSTLALLSRESELVEGLPTSYPVSPDAIVIREFGHSPDPFTGRKALHAGVDFTVHPGAPVHASGAGAVAEAGKDHLWGWFVRIDHGRDVATFYSHLENVSVKRGQRVERGQVIGAMGMSGVATGVHLHYELSIRGSKVDPMRYFLPELTLAIAGEADAPPDAGSMRESETRPAEGKGGT
jgi:murein DD-endopeptidase MepM/ murein hydrolase activator NlpD